MTEINFSTLYKTWTTDKLLDIVENPNDYQSLAVDAARLELESRQLTQELLEEAKAEQDLRRQVKANKQQKIKDMEDKVKSVGSSLVDTFNPIQKDTPTTDKYIKLISLFLGGLFLYLLYKEFGMLKFMFTDTGGDWDLSMVLYFLPIIILPAAALLFWFRKKPGWSLATLFFSYSATGVIPLFISEISRKPTGIPVLDTIFPTTSPTAYIGTFILFGGMLWVICKNEIRAIYNIDKRTQLIVIAIGTLIPLLPVFGFY